MRGRKLTAGEKYLDQIEVTHGGKHPPYGTFKFPKPKKRKSKADGGLTSKMLQRLALERDLWVERRNAGRILIRNKDGYFRSVFLGEEGTPDIEVRYVSHYGSGRVRYAETKTPIGKLSPAQKKWHARAQSYGFVVATPRTMEDVETFIWAIREDQKP